MQVTDWTLMTWTGCAIPPGLGSPCFISPLCHHEVVAFAPQVAVSVSTQLLSCKTDICSWHLFILCCHLIRLSLRLAAMCTIIRAPALLVWHYCSSCGYKTPHGWRLGWIKMQYSSASFHTEVDPYEGPLTTVRSMLGELWNYYSTFTWWKNVLDKF